MRVIDPKEDVDPESELLLPSEIARLRSSRGARVARATEEARALNLDRFTQRHRRYKGRVVAVDLPPPTVQLPYQGIRIRQRAVPEITRESTSADSLLDDSINGHSRPYIASAQLKVELPRIKRRLRMGTYCILNSIGLVVYRAF
jgi:hypothetical protein